jgi:5-methylcytosine-specific restriction protein A
MSGGWKHSTRRESLPPNWKQIRPAVIARDKVCQWPMPGGGVCGAAANQVDHKDDRNDHRLDALQLLCEPHHAIKSSAEGVATQPRERRPREKHPGLL